MGMIAVGTLTGCTPSLVRKLESHKSKMAALSSEEDQLLPAIARLDFKLLNEAREEILSAIETYQISPRALSRVSPTLKRVIDHFNQVGLVDAIEREWRKIQEAFQDSNSNEILAQAIDELRRAGIPQDKLTEYWRTISGEVIEFYPVRGEIRESLEALVQIIDNQDVIALSLMDCIIDALAATLLIIWISEPALVACGACAGAPSFFNPACWRCAAAIGISVIAVIRAVRTCTRGRGRGREVITP